MCEREKKRKLEANFSKLSLLPQRNYKSMSQRHLQPIFDVVISPVVANLQ